MFQSKLLLSFMDPEIVPGRTRGVTMGESSGKYYLRSKVPSYLLVICMVNGYTSVLRTKDKGEYQATNARGLAYSFGLGIESGRTWRSPRSIPKPSPYPQMHSSAMKVKARKLPPCHNSLATALLVDTYQITMAYAYWKNGTHARIAAFDLLL